MGIGLRAAARELGISHVALLKAKRSGRVTEEKAGGYDVEACRKALKLNSNPIRQEIGRRQQKPKGDEPAAKPKSSRSEPAPAASDKAASAVERCKAADQCVDDASNSLSEAMRQKEWIRVEKDRMELRKRQGELLESSEVEREWSCIVSSVRNALLLLPAKLAPKVAGVSDVRECQALVDSAIRAALKSLSEGVPA